jgi:hypothetical protein
MKVRLVIIFLILSLSLTSCILFLPSLINTKWGQKQLVALFNYSIPGKVEIGHLHLEWGAGQVLDDFVLKDSTGKIIVSIDHFSTEATLWTLLTKSTYLGHTELKGLNAIINIDSTGVSNLQVALGLMDDPKHSLDVISTIILSQVNGELNLFDQHLPLSFHLTGKTQQGELKGSFDIHASTTGFESKNWEQLKQEVSQLLSIEGSKKPEIQAKAIDFPVELLDQLASLKWPKLNGLFRKSLGDRLNINLDKEPSSEGLAFNLSVLSPFIQGNIKGQIAQEQFLLQSPATFHLAVSPEFIHSLTSEQFRLVEPSSVEIVFDEMQVPLDFLTTHLSIDPCKMSFKAKAHSQSIHLEELSLGQIQISDFNTQMDSSACSETIFVQTTGQAKQLPQSVSIPFNFELILTKPSSLKDLIKQLKKDSQASLRISHAPVSIFQSLFPDHVQTIQQLFGQQIDLSLNAQNIFSKEIKLFTELKTDYVTVYPVHFKLNDHLTLITPLKLEYSVQPDVFNQFQSDPTIQLIQPFSVGLTIHDLDFPLTDFKKGNLQAEMFSQPFQIDSASVGQIQFHQGLVHFKGQLEEMLTIDLLTTLKINPSDQTTLPLLRGDYNLSLLGQVQTTTEGKIELPLMKAQLNGNQGSMHVEGKLDSDYVWQSTKPLEFHYQITSKTLEDLHLFDQPYHPQLQNEPILHLTADPFTISLRNFQFEQLFLKGYLSIDRIFVKQSDHFQGAIEQLILPWEIDGSHQLIHVNLRGIASAPQEPKSSALLGRFTSQGWLNQGKIDLSHLQIEAVTQLTGIPTSFINTFVSDINLTTLLGPTVDIGLTTFIDRDHETPGYWDMHINSTLLHAKARLKFDEAITLHISQNNPGPEIRWTITPESYQAIKTRYLGDFSFDLIEPMTFTGTISQLRLPLNQTSFFQGGQIQAQFFTNQTRLYDQTTQQTLPIKLETQLTSKNLQQDIDFTLNFFSKNNSELLLAGKIGDFFNQKENKDWKQADLHLQLKAKQLPIDLIHSYQKHSRALIGDTLNGELHLHWNKLTGPISAYIEGQRGQVSFKGQVTKGMLTLTTPLQAQIQVTPLLTETFLNQSLPLLRTALGSDKPIMLHIEPQNFSMPLVPFNLKETILPKGVLHLGKIYFRNEGNLQYILSFIKPIESDLVTLWFTPVYFQLEKGLLLMKRVDLLVANEYSLASWGEIDVETHQADIILGVGSQALQYAFSIQDLEPDYMLQIPIKGRKGHLKVDKIKTAARISALVSQTQGGSKGKLLGNLLEIAATDRHHVQPPAPTTQPFPWQHLADHSGPTRSQTDLKSIDDEHVDPIKHSKKNRKKHHGLKKIKENLLKSVEEIGTHLIEDALKK